MKTTLFTLFLTVAVLAAVTPVLATADPHSPEPGEVDSSVPELFEFHEVIYPLWHHAWPEKDYAMMKELLPEVQKHVKAVSEAELPGILRDKEAAWEKGVEGIQLTLRAYEDAAGKDDNTAMRKAVEDLHTEFETLIRLIVPVMKELDAYHQVLYQIYHYDMPDENLEQLQSSSSELSVACKGLLNAEIPKRFTSKAEALKPEFDSLCQDGERLESVVAGGDWATIKKAVETVHTQYQKVEGLF